MWYIRGMLTQSIILCAYCTLNKITAYSQHGYKSCHQEAGATSHYITQSCSVRELRWILRCRQMVDLIIISPFMCKVRYVGSIYYTSLTHCQSISQERHLRSKDRVLLTRHRTNVWTTFTTYTARLRAGRACEFEDYSWG